VVNNDQRTPLKKFVTLSGLVRKIKSKTIEKYPESAANGQLARRTLYRGEPAQRKMKSQQKIYIC